MWTATFHVNRDFSCEPQLFKFFGQMLDTYGKLRHGNNYNHWKILDLVLDLNYFSFSNPNQALTRHTT